MLMCSLTSQEALSQSQSQTIVSPEVHPDKKVTFRFVAVDAKEVKINSQIAAGQQLMAKDEKGVWSITLGPVIPDYYPYCFVVDGVSVADPNNVKVFANERFKNSLVDIPGDSPLIHSLTDVPHGAVTYRYYNSKTLSVTRPLVIYTPPDYEKNKGKKYPVLYLIHGSTDTEETWFKVGRINNILDNLIAMGEAEPMIIVMPYGNPAPAPSNAFIQDLVSDVVPFTEQNYRVITESEKRAVAGFSRGGGQTLNAGLLNADLFGWIGAFSPSANIAEFEKYFMEKSPDPQVLNKQLKLFMLTCGTEDFLYERVTGFVELLERYNIKHQTFFPSGGHTWINCKLYMSKFAPLLFK